MTEALNQTDTIAQRLKQAATTFEERKTVRIHPCYRIGLSNLSRQVGLKNGFVQLPRATEPLGKLVYG